MKTIVLLSMAVVAGAARYPTEGPIPVRNDEEAQRLVDEKLAEFVEDDSEEGEDGAAADGLDDEKVADLKTLAELEEIDLGEASKKADIIAKIRAHRAANPAE